MFNEMMVGGIGGGGGSFAEGDIITADWTGTSTSDFCTITLGFRPKTVQVWTKNSSNISSACQYCYCDDINGVYGTQQSTVKVGAFALGGTDYYGQIYSINNDGFTIARYDATMCSNMHYVATG